MTDLYEGNDELYDHDEPDDDDEWQPGQCDHCHGGDENGVTADGPLGPIYCACFIGQGADEEDCHCGPPAEGADEAEPCARCS